MNKGFGPRVILVMGVVLAIPVALQGPGVSALEVATDLFTVVIPIAFSYAIVRHRILDIAIVVRIGLQYLLARNALRIAVAAPLLALLYVVLTNPDATMKEILIGQPMYVSLAVMAAGALTARKRLMVAIDRRFFREAYDRERLLQAILEDVDGLYANEQGLNRISERLDAALHPTALLFWFSHDDREHLRLSHSRSSSGIVAGETCSLSASAIQQLEHDDRALYVSGLTPVDDSGDVRDLCKRLDVELLVPMLGRDGRLRGTMMLGAKRSDEAYTPAELMLLQRIARQIGTVKEHVELRSRIEEEQRVRSEVLGHLASADINLLKECPKCGTCYDSSQTVCDLDGRELTMTLPVERTVESRYRLDRLIGRGGMGAVYAAVDLRLRREVAVKIMLGRNFGNQNALKRFDREARAVARLNHPNIVAVFDYGTLAGQGAFLVMERVEGVMLRTELNRQSRFPPPGCESWIAEILEGVAAAHAHGIIHRDLKPENVLIVSGSTETASRVKLLDFGLARFASSSTEETMSISATGVAVGTIAYMAPEQILGKAVDERTDIFSLGVMLLEILTGRRLLSANLTRRLAEIQAGIPVAMIDHSPLRVALERSVAAEPRNRYATVDELRRGVLPAIASWLATASVPKATPHPASGDTTC